MEKPSSKIAPNDACTLAIAAGSVVAVLAAVMLPHLTRAFFLYDDFAIVARAPGLGLRQLFSQATEGFFRPLAGYLFGVQGRVFGWSRPEGYAAVSLVLHVLNAALVALAVRAACGRWAAACTGFALFLASPWASEALFWTSAQFDLLATAGVLGTCLLATAALEAGGHQRTLLVAGAVASGVLALLSKESAVVLPAAFVAMTMVRPRSANEHRASLVVALVLGFVVLAFLGARSRLLPGLAGPYGRFTDLVRDSDLVDNGWRFIRCWVQLPLPRQGWLPMVVISVLAVLWVGTLGRGFRHDGRRTAGLALGWIVALAPVGFVTLVPGTTAGGRLLYLAGVFAVMLVVLSWERSRLAPLVFAILLGSSYMSLAWQERLWSAASHLSRTAIERFATVVPARKPIRIVDMPGRFDEGPYVLKAYAFRYFFGERLTVPVRAEALVLGWRGDRPVVLSSALDPFSDPPGGEETVLRLGVVSLPP